MKSIKRTWLLVATLAVLIAPVSTLAFDLPWPRLH